MSFKFIAFTRFSFHVLHAKWPTISFNFVMYLAILNNEILQCGFIRLIHGVNKVSKLNK